MVGYLCCPSGKNLILSLAVFGYISGLWRVQMGF